MTEPSTDLYSTWVTRVRAWAKDPTISVADLPPLTATSFSPTTYERLITHIQKSLAEVTTKWDETFARNLREAVTEHDRERALVNSRSILHRRVLFCRTAPLPKEVTDALMQSTETLINDLQKQLEDATRSGANSVSVNSASNERTLQLVRRNPLTAVLDPNYGQTESIETLVDEVIEGPHSFTRIAGTPMYHAAPPPPYPGVPANSFNQAAASAQPPADNKAPFFKRFRRSK